MKQLIIVETAEQQQLKTGQTLTLRFGDQFVDVAFEMNHRPKGQHPSEIRRRFIKEGDDLNQKRKSPTNIKCKQPGCKKLKRFKNGTAFMKHRHKVHKNGKHGKH